MYKTLQDIRRSLPKEKNAYDIIGNTAAFFLARPLSYPLTWLLLRFHITANAASVASIWLGAIACVQTAIYGASIYTVVLIFIWLVLDCVDGNIARVTKTGSDYGEFLDAMGSYILSAFLPIAIGFSINSVGAAALGALAAVLSILPRLFLNKRNNLVGTQRVKSGDVGGSRLTAAILSAYNMSGIGLFIFLAACIWDILLTYLWLQTLLGAVLTAGAFYQCKSRLKVQ